MTTRPLIPCVALGVSLCASLGIAVAPNPLPAQTRAPQEIGRLPVLTALPTRGACMSAPVTAELRTQGITRLVMLSDSVTDRMITLGVDDAKHPRVLMDFASKQSGTRRETETVNVFLDAKGSIVRGDRSYFTSGSPARMSDDRRSGLLATDSARARALAAALLRRCPR